MENFDVIVVGAGASGCISSIFAKEKYENVLIIDKQNKLAKKILVTGNGRCNLSNINVNSKCYNQNIDKYLNEFNVKDTLAFFNKIGLEYYSDDEGRIYPISNSAKSVVDVLTNKIEQLGIKYNLNTEVKNISKTKNKYIIETTDEVFSANKVIVATGGNSLTNIILNLGIKIKNFTPSLVSLKINSSKNLANVRLSNVSVKLITDNQNTYQENGEILFRENGISGICIFNLSAYLSRYQNFNGELVIDLLPFKSKNEIIDLLSERRQLNIPINKFFDGMFVKQIGFEILNRAKINEERLSNKLSDNEIKELSTIIKNLNFKVKGFLDNNQVYSGGISLSDLTLNLESKHKGLFFCGEICDVDGLCGGYNLQWAWTSGAIVGKNI